MKKALRILSCVALVLGVSGAAQALTPEQAACQQAWNAYNARVSAFNSRCSGVAANSPQAAQCQSERQAIMASRPSCR